MSRVCPLALPLARLRMSLIALVPCLSLVPTASAASSVFPPISTFNSGGSAQFTAVADFNHDGRLDAVVSNRNGVISFLAGNGNGAFAAPATIAAFASGVYPVVAADFNRDGHPDIAVLKPGQSTVMIFLGKGDGAFLAPKSIAVGHQPKYMLVADVNGDHAPDLIFSAGPDSSYKVGFTLLLGQGNGNFHAPRLIVSANGAAGSVMTIGDVNHDGHEDVVTCDGGGDAEVFLGNGDGTFREQPPFNDGLYEIGGETQLVLADFYGNGNLDLAVGNYGYEDNPAVLYLLQGNGDGTFVTSPYNSPPSLTAGFFPVWVAAQDMNGDGKVDLVIGNDFSQSVTVLLNKGSGHFTPSSPNNFATRMLNGNQQTPTPGAMALGDFNGDGKPDVIVSTVMGIDVLMNLGSGLLRAPASIEVGQFTGQIFNTDFAGHGHRDIAVATAGYSGYFFAEADVLTGNGAGAFLLNRNTGIGDQAIGTIGAGSFDGNGRPGIAAFGYASEQILQNYNSGIGTFTAAPPLDMPSQPPSFCVGDFNRDGYADLAVLDGNEVDIYINLHNGSYSSPVSYQVGVNPVFIATRDLNRDGKLDLMVANQGSDDISVLLGNGNGTFKTATRYPAGTRPTVLTTGDFNGDGKIDIAVGNKGHVAIFLGKGDGTFAPALSSPAHGQVTFLAQADLRGKGVEDLLQVSTDFSNNTVAGNVYLLSGKGNGIFSAPVAIGGCENPYWVTVGDFNEDGAPDVVISDYFYSSSLMLLLNQRGTRLSVKSSATSARSGQALTLTATLSASVPGAGAPGGTVAFKDGSKTIAIATISGGKATITTSSLGIGSHSIRASYWGNSEFNPHLSSPLTIHVN